MLKIQHDSGIKKYFMCAQGADGRRKNKDKFVKLPYPTKIVKIRAFLVFLEKLY